jgi:hypothetical protein
MFKRISFFILAFGALRLCAVSVAAQPEQSSVTLGWNSSAAPGVVGYRVYVGETSGNYTQEIDVGASTTAKIPGLTIGVTYYFAVTAYDGTGLESSLSSEISYLIPVPSTPTLQLSFVAGEPAMMSGMAPAGYQYDVLATTDLQNWSVIGNVAPDVSGSFQFTDPDAATAPARFYRLQQTAP